MNVNTESRKIQYVALRMVEAYNMRNNGLTLYEIGIRIGKNHSTVSHLVKRCRELIQVKDKIITDIIKSMYNDYGADI